MRGSHDPAQVPDRWSPSFGCMVQKGRNVVGYYENSSQIKYGFLYNGATQTYTTLDPPGASANGDVVSEATGISGGNVVGYYYAGTF